jgi:hypothetical protein
VIKYINPAATHELVSHLVERIDALEAEIVALKKPVYDASGLLEASGLSDLVLRTDIPSNAPDAKAKKAAYMRDYMAKKRAEKLSAGEPA